MTCPTSRAGGIIPHPSSFILRIAAIALLLLPPVAVVAQTFDHSHQAWTALLKKHVVLVDGGKGAQVRYGEFRKDRAQLKAYTGTLSRASEGEFKGWSAGERLAFREGGLLDLGEHRQKRVCHRRDCL